MASPEIVEWLAGHGLAEPESLDVEGEVLHHPDAVPVGRQRRLRQLDRVQSLQAAENVLPLGVEGLQTVPLWWRPCGQSLPSIRSQAPTDHSPAMDNVVPL